MTTKSPLIAPLYDLAQVAATLSVCTRTVRRLIAKEELIGRRVGNQIRVTHADLATYIARNKV